MTTPDEFDSLELPPPACRFCGRPMRLDPADGSWHCPDIECLMTNPHEDEP